MFNIAFNTFREIVRNKFLYMILFFGFLFIIFSLVLGQLTLGEDNKIIVDFGLSMIEIFGLIGVLFVGSQLLFKEVDGKTIFLILSKPIGRHEFILGKFLGFSATIAIIVFFQSILLLAVMALKGIPIDHLITMSLVFTFFKLEILLALVFFFSTIISNILTVLVSMMIYFASHSLSHVIDMAISTKNTVLLYITRGLELIFPPMQALNIKDVIGSFSNFGTMYFVQNTIYALVYIAVVMALSVMIFNKKKFET